MITIDRDTIEFDDKDAIKVDGQTYTFTASGIEFNSANITGVGDLVSDNALKFPQYSDNANAVQENRSMWYNDGSGAQASGYYANDGATIVGPFTGTSGESTDVSNNGTTQVTSTTDINFGTGLTAADDADGTATVTNDVTDTHTAVDDAGTEVYASVDRINFSTNLTVTDDTGGAITVEGSAGGDTHIDALDDGTAVVTNTGDVNFGTNLNVTDDGDGTVTVDGVDTNTQTGVSENGTQTLASVSDINFGANLDVTDDGDGSVTISGHQFTDSDWISRLIDSPNGNIMNVALDDGESAEISVPVPDAESLKVYRWGGYKISDGTAPTDLDVQLKDGSDTIQATENTANTENASVPVVSHKNVSGSTSIFKLAVANDTGSSIGSPGIGAMFSYVVE